MPAAGLDDGLLRRQDGRGARIGCAVDGHVDVRRGLVPVWQRRRGSSGVLSERLRLWSGELFQRVDLAHRVGAKGAAKERCGCSKLCQRAHDIMCCCGSRCL